MSNEMPSITTAEQLLAMPKDLGSCELVRGRLVMRAYMGMYEAHIAGNLLVALGNHTRSRDLGVCVSRPAGFLMARDPDTVRAPSVSFIGKDRVPRPPEQGYFQGPPDLAVEIHPPDIAPNTMAEKVDDHLRLGVRVVWDVSPEDRTITVHRRDAHPQIFLETDILTEPALLPGFGMLVRDLFAW